MNEVREVESSPDTGIGPGVIIDRRYRVDREIGVGGFAVVYAGTHLSLGVRVAIKTLRLEPTWPQELRAEVLAQFTDEARLATRLRHENIVRTLDQGIHYGPQGDPTPYLVLEWCGEENLKQRSSRLHHARLPLEQAYFIVVTIAEAMACAHEMGVAHRDLKPSNIMLATDKNGRLVPRIIDFGIGKFFEVGERAPSGNTVSRSRGSFTPAYASPEQLAGLRTGAWTDVHAIGLIFVELVTGKKPFGEEGASLGVVDPQRPTPAVFGVDVGAFEPVLQKALALRPGDRHRDASELLRALRDARSEPSANRTDASEVQLVLDTASKAASNARIGPAENTSLTDGPISKTIRTRSAPSSDRPGGRVILMAGVAAAVLLGGGFALKAWSPADRPSGSPSAASTPLQAPPPPLALSSKLLADVTLEQLEQRVLGAGCEVLDRSMQTSPAPMMMIQYRKGKDGGTVYLNEVKAPVGVPPASFELYALLAVKVWIDFDRDQDLALAYGVSDNFVLSVTGTTGHIRDLLKSVAEGLELKIVGSSFGSPNPASIREDAKPLWPARSLDDLTFAELGSRLHTSGFKLGATKLDNARWTLSVEAKGGSGELIVVRGEREETKVLEALRRDKKRFVRLRGAEVLIVAHGDKPVGTKVFLDTVLKGLVVADADRRPLPSAR